MPRLFTKFTSKSVKGTGLGLFISKNIIEAHGSKIWAETISMERELLSVLVFHYSTRAN
jgi:signal transduction histidine kinase